MRVEVLTLFPEFFESPLRASLLGKAIAAGTLVVRVTDIRGFAAGKHRVADDSPYGGGSGMVMKIEPVVAALEAARERDPAARRILLSPRGRRFTQAVAKELAGEASLALVCGHYEGIDERAADWLDDEISLGDYVLGGGESAALVVVEAVARLLPGFVGNSRIARRGIVRRRRPRVSAVHAPGGVPRPPRAGGPTVRRSRGDPALAQERSAPPDARTPSRSLRRARACSLERGSEARRRARSRGRGNVSAPLYVILLHWPVFDKRGDVVTTAVTNMDIHDLARISKTYGVAGLFIATPVRALRLLSEKIVDHWQRGYGATYNETRRVALALVQTVADLDQAILEIERKTGSGRR